jgi:regulator of sigma E protease
LVQKSHEDYTLGQAFVVGAGNAFDVVWKNIQGFKKIFSGQVRADKALSTI